METYKKVKTIQDIKNDPRVFDVYHERGNGYWIDLKSGYVCIDMECGQIHETTIKECAYLLNERVITLEEFQVITLEEFQVN